MKKTIYLVDASEDPPYCDATTKKEMHIHPARLKAREFLHGALLKYQPGDPQAFRDMILSSHRRRKVGAYGRKLWRQESQLLIHFPDQPELVVQAMTPDQILPSARMWSLERGLISPILMLGKGIYPEQLKEIWE